MSAQFEDGKDDGALRTIGEVSRALGIKTHVLRYWEQQFDMLEPLKRSGGRRYYRSEDVALIEQINRLVNDEGYTLKGAQQAIEAGKTSAVEDNEPAKVENTPAPAATIDPNIAPASDGGVDAFFGKEPEPAPAAKPEPETPAIAEASADEGMSRAEILSRLKLLRGRLADAVAA